MLVAGSFVIYECTVLNVGDRDDSSVSGFFGFCPPVAVYVQDGLPVGNIPVSLITMVFRCLQILSLAVENEDVQTFLFPVPVPFSCRCP